MAWLLGGMYQDNNVVALACTMGMLLWLRYRACHDVDMVVLPPLLVVAMIARALLW